MSLRRQLLFVSLLTLFLPWAGCQYITELESALRQGQQNSLQDSARAIASILQERRQLLYRYRSTLDAEADPNSDIYAHPISTPITLDGYNDDWNLEDAQYRLLSDRETSDGTLSVRYAAIANRNHLFLFLSVSDDMVVYRDASKGPVHDHVRLIFWNNLENFTHVSLATDAPGEIVGQIHDNSNSDTATIASVIASWQPTATGYNVEIRMPQSALGPRFGFAVIDGDAEPLDPLPYLGTVDPYDVNPLPALLTQPLPELNSNVEDLSQQNRRLRVVDRHGWVLAEGGQLQHTSTQNMSNFNLLDQIYLRILDPGLKDYQNTSDQAGKILGPDVARALDGKAHSVWYQPSGDSDAIISAAAPVYDDNKVVGAVVLEQTSAETILLTNNALKRILSVTLISTALVVAGLLGFATLLSLRIRRLRNATEHAMNDEGLLDTNLPGAGIPDELGDLSRSFQTLLLQLKDYTQYLKSLASKLSHELRTPLAVVQSSLDNLQSQPLAEQSMLYAERATAGIARLRHIVSAMSAASRVEQSIETAEFDWFDLNKFVSDIAMGYQDTYPQFVIDAHTPQQNCRYYGVDDLLAQMLDKLIENAVDFTPKGGAIEFYLESNIRHYMLRVTNEGATLPDKMKSRLFDSLISVRGQNAEIDDKTHLGFGLFIAKLVVKLHQGDIVADNLPDNSGVEFKIRLPRTKPIKP